MASSPLPRRRRLFHLHRHHHHLLFLLLTLLATQAAGGKVLFPGETEIPDEAPAASPEGVLESPGEGTATLGDVAPAGEEGETSTLGSEDQVLDPEARGLWESDVFFLQKLSNFFSGGDDEPNRPPPKRKVSSPTGLLHPPSTPPLSTRRNGVDRPGQRNVVRVPAGAPPPVGATPLGSRPPLDPKKIPVLIPKRHGGPPTPPNPKPLPFMTPPAFSPQHLQQHPPDGGGPAIQIQRVSVGHRPSHPVPQQQVQQQQQRPHVQTHRIQQTPLVQRVQQMPQPQIVQDIPKLHKVPQVTQVHSVQHIPKPQIVQDIPKLLKVPQVTQLQRVQHIPKPQIVQQVPHALKVPHPEGIKGLTLPKTAGPTASRPHSIQYTPTPHRIEHRPEPHRVQQKPPIQIQIQDHQQSLHHRPVSGPVKLKPLVHTVQVPLKRVVQGPQKVQPQRQQTSKVKFPELEAQGSDFTFSQTKNPARLSINLSPGLPVIPQVTVDSDVSPHDFPYPFVQPNLPVPTKKPPATVLSQPSPPPQPPPPPKAFLEIRPSKPIKPNSQLIKKPTSTFKGAVIVSGPGASTSGDLLRQPSTRHPRPVPQPTLVFHSLEEKKSSNLIKTSPQHAKTNNYNFNPSPLEGSFTADAFQPIFVASKSLDNGFGKDDMIPISVPNSARTIEKAKAKAGPSKPEMLDFF